jgi:hypothetical protein
VAELSRVLTSSRPEREKNYLERPDRLSAYLRYFLPWNVCRLTRLLPNLPLELRDGDRITDLGAGPLTFAAALWIARPDLRGLNLEFRCVDRAGPALEAGKRLFAALTETQEPRGASPWKIKTIRGSLDAEIRGGPAALVSAVNVYNELYEELSPGDRRGLEVLAGKTARRLASLAEPGGLLLVVEPGIPRSGEFIAALREALMGEGRFPRAPCTHRGACPLPGRHNGDRRGKERWCHFSFEPGEAPEELRRLSAEAGVPKERLALSFLLAGGREPGAPDRAEADRMDRTGEAAGKGGLRVISEAFPLPRGFRGRYGCGGEGLFLLRGRAADRCGPGSLLEKYRLVPEERDGKSGAAVVEAD